VPQVTSAPQFAEFVAGQWKSSCYDRCKPSTRKRMDSALATQLLPAFGQQRLGEVSRADVHRWFDEYSGTAPAGANRALDILRQLFNFAIACGHISSNPAIHIKRNRRPERTRFLSSEELARLCTALDEHKDRGSGRQQVEIIRLLLATGCRKSEILRLRWTEVDGDLLRLADSKTGPREVTLNLQAREILARQPQYGSSYVFPDLRDPSRCRSDELSLWRKLRLSLGIADVRLHDLRHTFASHAVMQKIPMPVVSRLLGHRKTRMTFRYAHVDDVETQKAAQRVGTALAVAFGFGMPEPSRGRPTVGLANQRHGPRQLESSPMSTHCVCCNVWRDIHGLDESLDNAEGSGLASGHEHVEQLLRKHLGDNGWSVTEAARRLGFSRQTLSRVLSRRMGISTAMALAFERIGWRNAEFWVCQQALGELDRGRKQLKLQSAK